MKLNPEAGGPPEAANFNAAEQRKKFGSPENPSEQTNDVAKAAGTPGENTQRDNTITLGEKPAVTEQAIAGKTIPAEAQQEQARRAA
jgi:hypothetical protein